jgi:hypothetical protein
LGVLDGYRRELVVEHNNRHGGVEIWDRVLSQLVHTVLVTIGIGEERGDCLKIVICLEVPSEFPPSILNLLGIDYDAIEGVHEA